MKKYIESEKWDDEGQGFKITQPIRAIRGDKTLSQLGSQVRVHSMPIAKWRKMSLDELRGLFVVGRTCDEDVGHGALYVEIGRLKIELGRLKKKATIYVTYPRIAGYGCWWGDRLATKLWLMRLLLFVFVVFIAVGYGNEGVRFQFHAGATYRLTLT